MGTQVADKIIAFSLFDMKQRIRSFLFFDQKRKEEKKDVN